MSATLTRRRRKKPQRLGPHPAGSLEAIALVRAFVVQETRLRDSGDEWARELVNHQRHQRRSFV